MVDYITVVGNLIGQTTVDVVPRVAGRIDSLPVKLGDRVTRGQLVAKIEDREIREQINQAQATLEVNKANVTQRENEVQLQQNALERTKTTFERGLTARQTARGCRGAAQRGGVAVARRQGAAVTDAVAHRRAEDHALEHHRALPRRWLCEPPQPGPGRVRRRQHRAPVRSSTSAPCGWSRISSRRASGRSRPAWKPRSQVDTFAGEDFTGRVSRVAPVFDPATRTAQMEIEVPNPGFRLKPGMYARVRLTVERRPDALTVPSNAVVDADGKRGVFMVKDQTAQVRGNEDRAVRRRTHRDLDGLREGDRVITTGALALRDGDRVALVSDSAGRRQGAWPAAAAGRTAAQTPALQPARPGRRTIAGLRHVDTPHRHRRPVTMFMLSAVVALLGAISLFRLPVDLLPDVTYPTITVRVGYGGVGPAEIEQLIVRPLEQSLAAVPGLEQINSTASEGSGTSA